MPGPESPSAANCVARQHGGRHDRHVVENGHSDGRAGIDAALVRRLIGPQFPQWADLPVTPVEIDGWDNRTYRLGDDTDRAAADARELRRRRWRRSTAGCRCSRPQLPVPIPVPVAMGAPGEGYPHAGRSAAGSTARPRRARPIADLDEFAADAGRVPARPAARRRHRRAAAPARTASTAAAPPAHYDDETASALAVLTGRDRRRPGARRSGTPRSPRPGTGRRCGSTATSRPATCWSRDGRLAAVIDFGTCGVGDPACDLVIAWTFFVRRSPRGLPRGRFRAGRRHLGPARGWALWKALIGLAGQRRRRIGRRGGQPARGRRSPYRPRRHRLTWR